MMDVRGRSPGKKQISYLRRLAGRRFREKEGRFLLEGVRPVEEALAAGWEIQALLYTPKAADRERTAALIAAVRERRGELFEVEEKVLQILSATVTPQGVVAVVRCPGYNLSLLLAGRPTLLVLVDGVQDPGNLGAIIRSADAAGADGVILLPGTVDLYNPKTVRATMGSLFHLPVVTGETAFVLASLAAAGLRVVIGVPRASLPIYRVELTGPVALAVGNEAAGPSPAVIAAGQPAGIPMPGRAESLNVAVAAAVMLYEAVRQRATLPIFQ